MNGCILPRGVFGGRNWRSYSGNHFEFRYVIGGGGLISGVLCREFCETESVASYRVDFGSPDDP